MLSCDISFFLPKNLACKMINNNLHNAQSSGHSTTACGSLTLPPSGAAPALGQSGTHHFLPCHVAGAATLPRPSQTSSQSSALTFWC